MSEPREPGRPSLQRRPPAPGPRRPTARELRWWLLYFALAAVAFWLFQRTASPRAEVVPYSALKAKIEAGAVERVTIGTDEILAVPTDSARAAGAPPLWRAAPVEDPGLVPLLEERGVAFEGARRAPWGQILGFVLPLLALLLFWIWMMRRMNPAQTVMQFGRTRPKLYAEEGTGVTFADVAGVDEAKQELEEVIEFLKNPKKFTRLGAKIPKGILLVGPPGTGKTLLARAVAGEAGVPFFSISGSEFVEMFVGVGAARVRDLFQQARAKAPCILFIDELDALAKARGLGGPLGGHDEREQTLNQLLVEMDGFDPRIGVIIMAATNRPEILDPAVLRPGRFDRHVLVDRPDVKGREAILRVHAKGIPLAPDVDLRVVAQRTPGFVGADLANLLNEAALLAARRNREQVTREDIDDAIDRIVAGLEKKNRLINPREKRIVAVHESGHALVALRVPHADPVHKVSIIPRGIGALGYTQQLPTEDRYLLTRDELLDRIAVMLGGRGAEELVFGEVSTGAQNDLQRATDLARRMVVEFGMSERIGPVHYGDERRSLLGVPDVVWGGRREYSEETAREIDEEVRAILDAQRERVRAILERDRAALDALAERLLEREVLEREEVEAIVRRGSPEPAGHA